MSTASPRPAPSNFSFLRAWPDLAIESARAERATFADPRAACFYARRALELAVHWLYDADRSLTRPYKDDLAAMLFEPSFKNAVDGRIRAKMDLIRRQGNRAVHDRGPVKADTALGVVQELFHVMFWLARTYAPEPADAPHPSLVFNPAPIPRPLTAEQRQASAQVLRNGRRKTSGGIRNCSAAVRRTRRSRLSSSGYAPRSSQRRSSTSRSPTNTTTTRPRPVPLHRRPAERSGLAAVGGPRPRVRGRPACRTTRARATSTTCCGATTASRSAWLRRSAPAAMRRWASARPSSMPTASRSGSVSAPSSSTPTATRPGSGTISYPPRHVQGFYTKDELALLINRRTAARARRAGDQRGDRRAPLPAARDPGDRRDLRENQRKALLVMATGAGKTRTVIALIDLLMRATGRSGSCS